MEKVADAWHAAIDDLAAIDYLRNRWEVFISWELCTGMSNKHNFLTNADGLMIVDSECVRRRDDER